MRPVCETPLISLVIPHYSMHSELARLLDSVLRQAPSSLEVIIVDDASPESCRDIADAYRNKGLDVRLLEHACNRGPMRARLTGIRAAAGRTTTFADADDVFMPEVRLEQNAASLLNLNADILHGNMVRRHPETEEEFFDAWAKPLAPLLSGEDIFRVFLQQRRATSLPAKIFESVFLKRIIENIPSDRSYRRLDNLTIILFAMAFADKYVGSDALIYYYHYTTVKIQTKRSPQQLCDFVFLAKSAEEILSNHIVTKSLIFQMKSIFLIWIEYCVGLMCNHLDETITYRKFRTF